jgi:ribulose-5-phosphate 4-epimerase/fuculose-1-phosphate aldolase
MDEKTVRLEVAACCRLAEYLDLFDFSGHVSARVPGTDFILINSRKSVRSDIGPQDIVKVNVNDDPRGEESTAPIEVHIHTAIYRRRPDVNAVAHLHSPAVIALSVTGIEFVPVIYRGYMFAAGVPLYDNSRTVNSLQEGQVLAETLGSEQAVIMRGHGSVVVADTVKALLYYSLSLELNAKNQLAAYQAGVKPLPLRPEELEEGNRHFGKNSFEKAWQYYVHKTGLKF